MSKNNYVDLRLNGRLFPTWVMMNFKKYTLPDIIREEGVDPCSVKGKYGLRTYQKFLSSYLSFKSPFRDILVYHGLGSGKTVSAINIYNVLFNFSPKWNVFLMIKASLKNDPWLKDLKNWLSKENNSMRWNNIYFVHYDSPFADRDFLETVKKADSSKTSLYIFDECHNFIRNVYNNICYGMFVTFKAPNKYTRDCFRQYGLLTDETGWYASMWRPFHMIGLETNTSILSTVLRNEPTGSSLVWNGDAVATAKHDLRTGDVLDGEGGYCVWAKAIPAKVSSKIGALPIGLAHNVKLKNPVKKDEIVNMDDVELLDVDDIISYRKNMETLLIED